MTTGGRRWTIEFTPKASRQYRDLPASARARLQPAIAALADDPRPPPPHGRKLKTLDGAYRLAVGEFRVVYELQQDKVVVLVVWVGNRRDAYRDRS